MTTLTITAKGQITLKKELLRHLGLGPGDTVDVTPDHSGSLTVRRARTGSMEDAFGSLKREGQKPLTIEEMNEVIAKGWAGQLDL